MNNPNPDTGDRNREEAPLDLGASEVNAAPDAPSGNESPGGIAADPVAPIAAVQAQDGSPGHDANGAKQQSGVSDHELSEARDLALQQELTRRTRRSFLVMGAAAIAGLGGWEWLRSRPQIGGIPSPFRSAMDFDRRVSSKFLFSDTHVSPEKSPTSISNLRVNEDLGMEDDLVPEEWKLNLAAFGAKPGRTLTMADIYSLPKTRFTTEFNCIEGWTAVVQWGGARFRDFISVFAPGAERARYASLMTPDGEYYVGIDMASMMHPQTLLCYERNGSALEEEHGAPLRLVIPVKYGIKNLKRIGTISFHAERPRDYWFEHGYDYYAGL